MTHLAVCPKCGTATYRTFLADTKAICINKDCDIDEFETGHEVESNDNGKINKSYNNTFR